MLTRGPEAEVGLRQRGFLKPRYMGERHCADVSDYVAQTVGRQI
jgi:hypothetical protein